MATMRRFENGRGCNSIELSKVEAATENAPGQCKAPGPMQPRRQPSAASGEVGKQRHDEKAYKQCANDPKGVHALSLRALDRSRSN